LLTYCSDICTQPRHEEIVTRASVAFRQAYRDVEFENVNGDICTQAVDAIGKYLFFYSYYTLIVNPANNQLAHNHGLSNALIVKGGQ